MDRDCENCIHKVNGACKVWECKFEPKRGMTKEEAIEIIECGEISNRWGKDGREVEKMAIKALKQKSCEDKYLKEIDHLRKYISKLETQIVEQEPKSEWQQDHEILKAYSDGASAVLDKIRAEIETKYGHCNLCEYGSEYDRVYTDIGDIADILQIIDKYMAERSGEE